MKDPIYELLNDIYSYLSNGKATLNDFSNFEFYCEFTTTSWSYFVFIFTFYC